MTLFLSFTAQKIATTMWKSYYKIFYGNGKHKLLVKIDSSRRCTNPDNYDPDGTIKKLGGKKVFWYKSNRYIKLQNRLKEIYRKQADVRKYQHEV